MVQPNPVEWERSPLTLTCRPRVQPHRQPQDDGEAVSVTWTATFYDVTVEEA